MKISSTKRYIIDWMSQAHVAAYKLFGGVSTFGLPTLILTVRGRKSGRPISKPLLYLEDGGHLYVAASYGGSDSPPSWYLNLTANPDVEGQLGRETRRCRARTLPFAERDAIWPKLVAMYPSYAEYQKNTSRVIPVVELTSI
ncbi:MAG: nitroreductase family deazaflavin-dependent oxidoreductase [Candidatus Binatus sp.]|uniref:nitroreductase family deazaflavin-dependent oxidoreductase n=1 Tax=Candidatus Binatus sp. TaxID=2811406 RepID=UPI0027205F31|nr:nitroreductase family deazaflavin-dependent oxidoreductase [Candidatus Binatus sp.]MDO8430970.1 nitroreductase family deazaflavin-dependent oxidoreductase [Candidatus Binatus sp.]